MDIEEIQKTIETIQTLDEQRREEFKREYREMDQDPSFSDTRQVLEEEREELARLEELLQIEGENLEELVDYTDFLSVDQAVRHRDQAVSKLEARNDHLVAFHEAMIQALNVIETNIDSLEAEGEEAVEADPSPHLEEAQEALEAHNDAVQGLEDNMEILNAYLM